MNLPENRSEKTVKVFIALPAFLALISLLGVGFLPLISLTFSLKTEMYVGLENGYNRFLKGGGFCHEEAIF